MSQVLIQESTVTPAAYAVSEITATEVPGARLRVVTKLPGFVRISFSGYIVEDVGGARGIEMRIQESTNSGSTWTDIGVLVSHGVDAILNSPFASVFDRLAQITGVTEYRLTALRTTAGTITITNPVITVLSFAPADVGQSGAYGPQGSSLAPLGQGGNPLQQRGDPYPGGQPYR